MERGQDSRKGKHLTRDERMVVERMSRGGRPPRDIAAAFGRHPRTIERELARGRVQHKDSELRAHYVYSSDRGQEVHELNATARGPELKLGHHHALAEFVCCRIVDHKESPAVVAARMRQAGMAGAVCMRTLYRYIDQGTIPGVSNASLWEKRSRHPPARRRPRRASKRLARGTSIDRRPAEVLTREQFGHWEMDLVVGPVRGSRAALLTLVERKHRQTLIRKLPDKTQASVVRALGALERYYGPERFPEIFKSITMDNGSEFQNDAALEASSCTEQPRTRVYYAHAYAAWERGSNENANRMIRRFIAKGHSLAALSEQTLANVESWINNYPRKILDFATPESRFQNELRTLV